MAILETFALTITTALAKHMLSQWLGSSWQTQVGQDFLDLLRDTTVDKPVSRDEAKQIERVAGRIVASMDSWVRNELRDLTEGDRRATLIEIAQTLASVDARLLVSQRLNADLLFNALMASRPNATALLSEEALSLYDRIISESVGAIIDSAHALPGYRVVVDAVLLDDHDRILSYSEQVLEILRRQDESLQALRDALKRSTDPYAQYLVQLYKRINGQLNHAFGITSLGIGIPLAARTDSSAD